jgi:hypothetical protein
MLYGSNTIEKACAHAPLIECSSRRKRRLRKRASRT